MTKNYEILLKEQIMQSLLGNTKSTLQDYVETLTTQNKKDIKEIWQAYFVINREILGEPLKP